MAKDKNSDGNAVSQVAFSKILNKSRTHVTQLKQQGRLVMSTDGKKVLVKESLKSIADSADPNRDDVAERHAAGREAKAGGAKPGENQSGGDLGGSVDDKATFSKGRAKEQYFKALAAEADYLVKIGQLVDVADMKAAVTDAVMMFKQSLETLPHRISPDLVGKDLDASREILRKAIFSALSDLQKGLDQRLKEAVNSEGS